MNSNNLRKNIKRIYGKSHSIKNESFDTILKRWEDIGALDSIEDEPSKHNVACAYDFFCRGLMSNKFELDEDKFVFASFVIRELYKNKCAIDRNDIELQMSEIMVDLNKKIGNYFNKEKITILANDFLDKNYERNNG